MAPPKSQRSEQSTDAAVIAEASAGRQAEAMTEAAGDVAGTTPVTVGEVLRNPLAATGQLLSGLGASARRPDAVLYWGGLTGAVLLGAIDWPVAVAVGIGVAVARNWSTPTAPPTTTATAPPTMTGTAKSAPPAATAPAAGVTTPPPAV